MDIYIALVAANITTLVLTSYTVQDYISGKIRIWQDRLRYPGFYNKLSSKSLGTIGNKKILYLFRGKDHGINYISTFNFSYVHDFVYTVDIDPKVNADFVADATNIDFYQQFEDGTFDYIIMDMCKCYTQKYFYKTGLPLFSTIISKLKQDGVLYIKNIQLLKSALQPVSLDDLNDLGLRGLTGQDLVDNILIGSSYHTLIKNSTYPELTDDHYNIRDYNYPLIYEVNSLANASEEINCSH